jgi:hypothetical protein
MVTGRGAVTDSKIIGAEWPPPGAKVSTISIEVIAEGISRFSRQSINGMNFFIYVFK